MSLSAKLVALVEATEELMPYTTNTNCAASLHVRRKKKSARPSMNIQCELLTTLERALLRIWAWCLVCASRYAAELDTSGVGH